MDPQYRTITRTTYKVADLLSWQRGGSLQLSPIFQRRPSWSPRAKSFLIDTVIRGLPTPIIILREKTDLSTLEPRREVVDGQQRLRTIFSFVDPDSISDYDEATDHFRISRAHNRDLAGSEYADLSAELKRRMLNYEFSVHVLPADTDDREVLEIFSRLNATGVKLNRQEIRNAEFAGEFKTLMYELAHEQLDRWRSWKIFTEGQIARMAEVEETSDFVVLMMRGVHGQTADLLDGIYKDLEEDFPHGPVVGERFRRVMDRIDDDLGAVIPRTRFRRKVLFHTLFTFLYDRLYGLGSPLERAKAKPLPPRELLQNAVTAASARIAQGDLPEDLAKALRGATNDRKTRQARLDFLAGLVSDLESE